VSGHLRWLAAQALGQSSGVRPARRPPLLYDMPQPSGVQPGAPGMPMEEPPPTGRADARLAERVRSADPSDAPQAFVQARAEPRRDAGIAAPVPERERGPEPEREQGQEPEREDSEARTARHDEHPVATVQIKDGEPADDDTEPRLDTRVVVRDVIADPPRRQPVRPAPRAARFGRRAPERVAPEPAVDAPSPPPDVHIHIGRVELTAVATPQPARRESVSAKKPMSLDEYLRRRSGRER
jgi:hypothetical protein